MHSNKRALPKPIQGTQYQNNFYYTETWYATSKESFIGVNRKKTSFVSKMQLNLPKAFPKVTKII